MVSSVSSSSLEANAQAGQAAAKLTNDFDSFLTLLTTQLQNQDPLEPMKSQEFTNQLVQFSSVEQSIATNTNLEQLLNLTFASFAGQAVSYIGKEVVAESNVSVMTDGYAEWNFELEDNPTEVVYYVTDTAGKLIYKETGDGLAGNNTFSWDGKDINGMQKSDGSYTLTVAAIDEDGNEIPATMKSKGLVTAVDFDSDTPVLTVNGSGVRLSDVISVSAPDEDEG